MNDGVMAHWLALYGPRDPLSSFILITGSKIIHTRDLRLKQYGDISPEDQYRLPMRRLFWDPE